MNKDEEVPTLWPSGKSRPILELAYTSSQLKDVVGNTFKRVADDLDWCERGYVFDDTLGAVAFIKYDNLPSVGTIIFVDAAISDVLAAIDHLIDVLKPESSGILWRASGEMLGGLNR